MFLKNYRITLNNIGYLYRNGNFKQLLSPGTYQFWDFKRSIEVFTLPTTSEFATITNQEVLTKDNIALRFSFSFLYKVVDGQQLLSQFSLEDGTAPLLAELELRLAHILQLHIRNKIASMDSETLNEKRHELADLESIEVENQARELGVVIQSAQIRDITFPKVIQDLFSKHLEAKIRAKADLENARTAVATARTLKNAAELIKGDDNIRFFQLLETISKIAEKGKHTFNFGDMLQLSKSEEKK